VYTRVHQVALSELLFVADNLAYFSYQQLDEPLFVMNQIDITVSTSGSLALDTFNEVTATISLLLLKLLFFAKILTIIIITRNTQRQAAMLTLSTVQQCPYHTMEK